MKARVIATILLMSFVVSTRCSAAPLKLQAEEVKLPGGFSGVYLGMPLKELLQVRQNARPFSLFPDNFDGDEPKVKRPPTSFVEGQMKHPLFDSILYRFEKGALDTVLFEGQQRSGFLEDVNRDFVSELVGLYGKPSALGVKDVRGGSLEDMQTVLMWRKESFLIAAFFPVTPPPQYLGMGEYALKIGRVKAPEDFGYEYPRITRAQEKKFLAPIRASLKKLLPAQVITEADPPVNRTMRKVAKPSGVPSITSPIMVKRQDGAIVVDRAPSRKH